MIKIVTGIRRCGKSSLLKMFSDKLQQDGVRKEQIQSVNFEDLDNEPLLDYKRLHSHIKERLLPDRMNYLFSMRYSWSAIFRNHRQSVLLDNVDIYITGSNAYLLSGEIATLLTGRYVEIKLFPFSFSEFIMASGKPQSLEQAYRQYVECGSFPYVTQICNDKEMVREYLSGLYNTIVLKDVVGRKR